MASKPRIYLDHAATTPIGDAAQKAFAGGMAAWANPSSPHMDGRNARAALEDARSRIANALDWDGDIIFTSGASEAISIALGRTKKTRIVTTPVEHDAVLRIAKNAEKLAVDLQGRVVLANLEKQLGNMPEETLVAVQSVNNETGVMQDMMAISSAVKEAGAVLFGDCAQSAGKKALPDADMISISAHKFGGPPGFGALLIRDLAHIHASGGQEKGYRSGTENLPAALSMAAALEASRSWTERAAELREQLDKSIAVAGGELVAGDAERLPTIGGYRMPGVAANAQLIQFDLAGISVSAGSACSSGTLKTSHVLSAMGWEDMPANEVVRVSFGPDTSRSDIYAFVDAWKAIFERAKGQNGA
ncbi:aminotransferase class V-fold PLP-dependent enzyme [Sphingorhabdus sp. Alg239-R122]|uniref:cysteine desulfurase family protein n=1 Tax=Sphingorhabdus sp. Alg239-R122 TaxID=2305989 RepID=UPI0013DBD641|nr:aminotransferase class V-fold PLP-dependent enzyme [Sphingorhabdus sp. Alg239-R122]